MPSENKRQSLNALVPGTVLRDYIIESELGSGGFSIVYLARHHLKAGWLYAIKEFLPGELAVRGRNGTHIHPVSTEAQSAFDDGLQRFRGEAEQLRKFRNERYIVSCQNYFEENGTAYLVMDYDDGLPLSEFLLRREAAGQPFTEADLLAVVEPLLEGLSVVHRADVLHRDIKPGNIFVRRRNDLVGRPAHPVLIDFGAAKQNYLVRHSRSHAPYTPGYAAYEQVSSMGGIGPWTDIYAVGALMWRMVAGGCRPDDSRLLVPDESTGTLVRSPTPRAAEKRSYAVHRGQPDPMVPAVELGTGQFSRHLLEAIDGCLALYPENRVQSCEDMRKLLKTPAASANASSPQQSERNDGMRSARINLDSSNAYKTAQPQRTEKQQDRTRVQNTPIRMSFWKAIQSGIKGYFKFSGRASRSEYWYFNLFLTLLLVAAGILDAAVFPFAEIGFFSTGWLFLIALPYFSIVVRRLHDKNLSGWWIVLWIISGNITFVIPLIFFITLGCLPSDKEENRYGPNPLSSST